MDPEYYYTVHGRVVRDLSDVPKGTLVQAHPRLLGGKGGFGSMLRAIGSQIEKTTNREMCRDLTGRRMRDVNMEAKMKEWLAGASARQREELERKMERRRRRRELLKNGPIAGHKFEDRQYDDQKREIAEQLESAVEEALRALGNPTASVAGPSEPPKRQRRCLLDDDEDAQLLAEASDSSLSSSSSSGSSVPASPGPAEVEQSDPGGAPASPSGAKSESMEPPGPSTSTNQPATTTSTTSSTSCTPHLTSPLDLAGMSSPGDLEAAGLDFLKSELTSRGLKCGGTLTERAHRLWAVRGLQPEQYPPALLAKPLKRKR